MAGLITTKPFVSTAQQRFAFGTGQLWAKRWARETDFAHLPKRVRLKLRMARKKDAGVAPPPPPPATGYAHGPGGLLSAPGLGGAGKREKAWSDAAREAALAKRRENAVSRGPTTSGSDARALSGANREAAALRRQGAAEARRIRSSVPKLPKGGKGGKGGKKGGGKGGKGKDPAALARQAKRDAEHAADRQQRAQDRTARAQRQQQADARRQTADERRAKLDAQHEADRQARLDRQAKLDARRERLDKLQAQKRGGGGKAKPTTTNPLAQQRQELAQQRLDLSRQRLQQQQQAQAQRQASTQTQQAAAQKLASGATLTPSEQQTLIDAGLAHETRGAFTLTRAGRAAAARKEARMETVKAEEYGGVKRSDLNDSDFVFPDSRSFPIKTSADVSDAVSSWGRYKGPHSFDDFKRRLTAIAKRKGFAASLPKEWQAEKAASSFTVYKDASGAWRWLAVSSSAYRDRDGEIVSTKALENAVAIGDATGFRGPLRWWHCGVPFGPGLDLGDCDFQAVHGRMLVESGTFKSEPIALAFKDTADEVSIGFTHPPDAPDADKVFGDVPIVIFERSLAPRGRVSNLFTSFTTTKEAPMDATKIAALKERIPDDLLQTLLASVEQTEKAADAAGVVYKADEPQVAAVIAALKADPNLLATAIKAIGDMEGGADGEEEKATDAPVEAVEGEEPDGDENMLTPAECQQIAQMTAQAVVEQLLPHLGIGGKMDELKSMLGGMAGSYAKKDDTQAEQSALKQQIEQLSSRLKELEGDAPRAIAAGFKASAANSTIVQPDSPLAQQQPKQDPSADFWQFMFPGQQPAS